MSSLSESFAGLGPAFRPRPAGRGEAKSSTWRRRGYDPRVPIYEFRCEACGERFEALVAVGTEEVECRACEGPRAERVLSAQAPPFGLVKSPGSARAQERRNASLRERTKAKRKRAREG